MRVYVCVSTVTSATQHLYIFNSSFFFLALFSFFFLIPYKRLWVRDKYVSSPIYPLLSLVNCYNYFFLPCATFFAQVRRLVICNDMEAVGGYWETDEGCCGSRVKIWGSVVARDVEKIAKCRLGSHEKRKIKTRKRGAGENAKRKFSVDRIDNRGCQKQ